MTEPDTDGLLDDLFKALAPVERPADPGFVAKVDLKVAELERYRLWRVRKVRRLATEVLATAAVGAAAAYLSLAPGAVAALTSEPSLSSAGLLVMLLCWLGVTTGRPSLLHRS